MLKLLKKLILASRSPRRREILENAGFEFEVEEAKVEEDFPEHLNTEEVPVYLAEKKAQYFKNQLRGRIILTADTIVSINGRILGKPANVYEAREYLQMLSDNTHQVTSGVCLLSESFNEVFHDTTEVVFKGLTEKEIDYYIENYKPFDKAGAYAIQEWIGMIGIEKIKGSYYNVMGLPIHKVYERLAAYH